MISVGYRRKKMQVKVVKIGPLIDNMIMIITIIIIIIIQNFIHRFKKKIDYLQIQEYEILKYIPYVHSSCVRKRIVVK